MKTTMFSNGVSIINCTPHEIRFLDGGSVVTVAPSGYKINATAVEETVAVSPCQLVKTRFLQSEQGLKEIREIREMHPGSLIVGSIISAQAYPGMVVGMTPAAGYERAAPAEKLMSSEKFSIF